MMTSASRDSPSADQYEDADPSAVMIGYVPTVQPTAKVISRGRRPIRSDSMPAKGCSTAKRVSAVKLTSVAVVFSMPALPTRYLVR